MEREPELQLLLPRHTRRSQHALRRPLRCVPVLLPWPWRTAVLHDLGLRRRRLSAHLAPLLPLPPAAASLSPPVRGRLAQPVGTQLLELERKKCSRVHSRLVSLSHRPRSSSSLPPSKPLLLAKRRHASFVLLRAVWPSAHSLCVAVLQANVQPRSPDGAPPAGAAAELDAQLCVLHTHLHAVFRCARCDLECFRRAFCVAQTPSPQTPISSGRFGKRFRG